MTARAQSETVGVILLTAIVVLTVGTAGAVVLAGVDTTETVRADLAVTVADDGVAVTHDGGQPVAFADLQVVVRNGDGTWRPPMNESGVIRGDDDGEFEPGERWAATRDLNGDAVTTVQVVERESDTVLVEVRRYPGASSTAIAASLP